MRTGTLSLAASVFATGLVALALPGCGQSDMRDYHPIDKTAAHSGNPSSVADIANSPTGIAISADAKPAKPIDLPDPDNQFAELPVSALVPVNVVDGASVAMLLKVVPGEPAPTAAATAVANNAIQPVSATSPVNAKPRAVELLIPERSFQRDASSRALRVSFDDLDLLKVLNLEPVTEVGVGAMPAWLKGLDGQRIRIRGFMYPTFEAEGIERFVLARDNQICCFGRDPKVYDLVQVDMRSGKTTNYIPATRAFDVIGRFKIEMVAEDGKPYGLYYIEDAEIIDR